MIENKIKAILSSNFWITDYVRMDNSHLHKENQLYNNELTLYLTNQSYKM